MQSAEDRTQSPKRKIDFRYVLFDAAMSTKLFLLTSLLLYSVRFVFYVLHIWYFTVGQLPISIFRWIVIYWF